MESNKHVIMANFNNHAFQSEKEALSFEKKAQDLIHSLTKSFIKEANHSLLNMQHALEDMSFLKESEKTRVIQTIFFQSAHDLKGQGETYGYPLITKIAGQICSKIKKQKIYSEKDIFSFKVNVSDMIKLLQIQPNHKDLKLEKSILQHLECDNE